MGLAFDGTNVWVVTAGYRVDKVSPTGDVTEYPTDFTPHGVAFDGTHIWVTNNGGSDVTKIVAATGATAGTYLVGGHPEGSRSTARTCGSRTRPTTT